MDRRVIKTKRAIRNAFLKLLTEKDLNDITVTDIAAIADINRKTFYNYYGGVHQVMEEIENEIIRMMENLLRDLDFYYCIENPVILYQRLCQLMEGEDEFYSLLFQMKNSALFAKLEKKLLAMTMDAVMRQIDIDPRTLETVITFTYAGQMAVYREWLAQGSKYPVEELAKTINELCLNGLRGILAKNSK